MSRHKSFLSLSHPFQPVIRASEDKNHWNSLTWNPSKLLCVLALSLLCFARFAEGQVTPGLPSFVPQDCGQYDCVNLQNLNVSLSVPLYSKSGAFPLNFGLSGGASFMINKAGTMESGILSVPLADSVNGVLGYYTMQASPLSTSTGASCPVAGGSGSYTSYSAWQLLSIDGTQHSLPASDISYSGTHCSYGFTDQVIDGTGWTLSVTSGTTVNSIYASNGMNITSGQTLVDPQSSPNKISYGTFSGITGWADTLLNAAPTAGANTLSRTPVSNGTDWAWSDANGNTQTASLVNTSVTLKTSFACSGIIDENQVQPLPTAIDFPDTTNLGLAWESNEVTPADYTGRLASITLRDGVSKVSFNYNPASASSAPYGLDCTTLIPNGLNRTTSDGTVSYSYSGTNSNSTTTKLDIGQNKTVYTFENTVNGGWLLLSAAYYANKGSIGLPSYASAATRTDTYCYKDALNPSCTGTRTAPFTEIDHSVNLGLAAGSAEQATKYDAYGNVTYSAQYDWGGATPVVATTNTMAVNGSGACSGIGATVNNKVCSSTTTVNGNTVAASKFAYDAHGNLTTASYSPDGGTTYLSNATANSYNSNGTPSTLYDLAGNGTGFTYNSTYYSNCGSCSQQPFPTRISSNGLSSWAYYNGYSGTKTKTVDPSGNGVVYCYNNTTSTMCTGSVADPWNRVMALVDPLNNEVFKTYSVTSLTSNFSFGSSVNNVTTTLDGYGRVTDVQKQQAPSSSNYDTVSTYRGFATVIPTVQTTNPCSEPSGTPCGTTYGPTAGGSVSSGGLVSTTLTQSGSNAKVTTTYNENDATSITTPAPSGENSKGVEIERDGLGRITSSCAISSTVSGKVSCGQNTGGYSGILTTTSYSSATGSQTVKSCRGPSCAEYRQMKTDGLGRVLSKYTPEGGTWTYVYDANASCPAGWRGASGQLASSTDPNGNLVCYSYDSSNRVTGVNANGTACRWFYYDNSSGYTGTIPTGVSLSNQYGRMVEAATDACTAVVSHTASTLITDLWWAYDKDGHVTTQWESTPNSGGYYEATASFFGNGAVDVLTLASPSVTSDTYTLDGEGRWNSMYAGGYQIVASSGVTYNPAGEPTAITISASTLGYDNYTYDAHTLRMTQYEFQVGSGSSNTDTGVLTWNPIGSLKSLAITDDFNANGSITCSYNTNLVSGTGYDDLNRLIGHSCTGTGGTWSQAFSYDRYDNITKTGSGLPSWSPGSSGYTTSNQYTCTGCTYDSNGNVTNDGTNAYTWNAFSKMASVNMSGTGCATNGDCIVYDALGRVVEIDDGSTKEEIWYTQLGKTAYMNGQRYLYGYFPGPGGGTLYNSTACPTCWMHKDWLGNARLISRGTTIETDRAYAPYGEMFNVFGGTNQPWAMFGGGITQDILAGMYDTPNRELQSTQGRFLSPDPVGSGWNQYAWPANPNSFSDPSGLGPLPHGGPPVPAQPPPMCQGSVCALSMQLNSWNFAMAGSGTVAADGGSGTESVTTTILLPDDDGTLWYTDNGGYQWFSADNGQTWDMQIYGLWGSGGEVFGAGNAYQGSGVDSSTSVQIGFIETDGTNSYFDVNPGVNVSANQTLDGPTPDQTVLFNVSGGDLNSVGTSIVQNPDGTISNQGTTFSESYGANAMGPWQVQFPLYFGTPHQSLPIPMTVQTNFGPVDLDPCFCPQ
jgi:RHS repeat-associated protein